MIDVERRFAQGVRRAWRPPERLSVAAWAERHLRFSTKVSNYPGAYRSALTPYVRGVFAAFEDPGVERIDLCWAAQTAKTSTMLVCMLYTLSQDPGPILWSMSTEDLARAFSRKRLQPLIDDTPALTALKPANLDLYGVLEMGMRTADLALCGANSPTRLSSNPIRYYYADEIDKYPLETTREGSALNLGIRRTAAFWNRKVTTTSTPTLGDGQIWTALLAGDWRQFWVPCPHCGAYQVLLFEQIKRPHGVGKENYDAIREAASYECAECGALIENHEKAKMLAAGYWRPRTTPAPDYEWDPKWAADPHGRLAPVGGGPPSRVSFHLPSWYSPWVRFGDVLARFLAARKNPEELREVINSDFAEPWQERGEAKSEDELLQHRGAYNPGAPPSDAGVTATILTADVQQDYLLYVVRGWGPHEESWKLAHGTLPDFAALRMVIGEARYGDHAVDLALIDSGYRTDEVYEFCRSQRHILPTKGDQQTRAPISWSTIDRMPGTNQIIPGGQQLVLYNAHFFKEALHRKWDIRRGDPGYWHLDAETSREFVRQLTAEILSEKKNARGAIIKFWRRIRRDNHYLDLEAMQLLGARLLNVRDRQPGQTTARRRPARRGAHEDDGWLGKTANWL